MEIFSKIKNNTTRLWWAKLQQSLHLRAPLNDEEWLAGAHIKLNNKFLKLGRPPAVSLRIIATHNGLFTAADGRTSYRYVKVLKNATSSILHTLITMTNDPKYQQDYLDSRAPYNEVHIVRYARRTEYVTIDGNKPSLYWFLPSNAFQRLPLADICFCVVRDPVERFVSAYLNRIQNRNITNWESFDQFVEDLESQMAHQSIWPWRPSKPYADDGHFYPQIYFLGRDPDYYTHIFPMRQLSKLEALLSQLAQRDITLRRINHSDNLERPKITPALKRRIRALYAQDYDAFGKYF